MKLAYKFLILGLFIPFNVFSQNEFNNRIQYGISLKLISEISLKKNTQKPFFRLALSSGLGSLYCNEKIYPSIISDVYFYNGGLGSNKSVRYKVFEPKFQLDFVLAFTLTYGWGKSNIVYNELQYFSNFSQSPLLSPFESSVSFGTNLIFSIHKKTQRIGFINFHYKNAQFSYYNDGGALIRQIWLGDRKDRYYTGGGVFTYQFAQDSKIQVYYNKFSGYSINSFESSYNLGFSETHYKDNEQHQFNKSIIGVSYNNDYGFGGYINFNNSIKLSAQALIHWLVVDSYHIEPLNSFVSTGLFLNESFK